MAAALLETFDRSTQPDFGDLLTNLEAAGRGEPQAADQVIGECLPQVSAYLARRGSADPDGLANSVMVEFLRNLHRLKFSSTGQVWSYLNAISRSRLGDERRNAVPERPAATIPERRQDTFDEHLVNQIWVASMLAPLTEAQREVLELRFLNDLTIEETAIRMGKSQAAVKGLQRRAIKALLGAAGLAALVAAIVGSAVIVSNTTDRDPAVTKTDTDTGADPGAGVDPGTDPGPKAGTGAKSHEADEVDEVDEIVNKEPES